MVREPPKPTDDSDKGEARRAYHPSELPEHLKRSIQTAKMDHEHRHLDDLLDE
ncbi:MAG: hypothetical protein HQL39_15295 [Alphaproteobacteria bacterium]|nr:hypothetical protein [Alphaproteobacteria bacterium]